MYIKKIKYGIAFILCSQKNFPLAQKRRGANIAPFFFISPFKFLHPLEILGSKFFGTALAFLPS